MCALRDVLRTVFIVICVETSHTVFGGQIEPDFKYLLYKISQNTSAMDLLSTAQKWLADDNRTAVVDMTNDCRLSALAAVTQLPLVRASVVSCDHVYSRTVSARATLQTYVTASFTTTPQGFSNCLARVVLVTEYATDVTSFPRCATSAAIPLLMRVLGEWPVSSGQIAGAVQWLSRLATLHTLHYVTVIGKTAFLKQILEDMQPDHLPQNLRWMFLTTDATTFDCTSCPALTTVIVHSEQYVQDLPVTWKNISGLTEVESLILLKAAALARETLKSGVTDEMETAPNVNFSLDFYSVQDTKALNKLGVWTPSKGLVLDKPELHSGNNSSVLAVATLHAPPFIFRRTDDNGTAQYSGYAVDVWNEIASTLNLTYYFTEPFDQEFGVLLENGTWTGIVGMVVSGTADLAVAPLTVSAEREVVVDFTTPFYEFAGIEILMQQVKTQQNLLFFVTVFSNSMWGAWLGVLLFTGLLLAVFDYFSPYNARNSGRDTNCLDKFDIKEGLWLVTASFTLSGPERTPRALSSRILVAGFWFFCSTTMANYTANLAAFLTTSRLTTSINSLSDLTRQSAVQYSVVGGTSVQTYFERMAMIEGNFYEFWKNISSNAFESGDLQRSDLAVWDYPLGETYVKAWSDIQRYGLLKDSKEGLERVMAGGFALIDDAPYVEYEKTQRCGLITIGKQFSIKSYALALPQGSPLTERISNVILKCSRRQRWRR
ncbi:ionotropic receptor 25a-like isoform X2 [Pomacea canaliculata]|uniref:ionotropic receptor 25a-like isoform X2 n=1 Tax=Pomacea canaliculata TaxID=400727 RepID=UPI000D738E0B|nr:ionotropic receptor 25a-like isoform X2 [Pomacea canaliculata]